MKNIIDDSISAFKKKTAEDRELRDVQDRENLWKQIRDIFPDYLDCFEEATPWALRVRNISPADYSSYFLYLIWIEREPGIEPHFKLQFRRGPFSSPSEILSNDFEVKDLVSFGRSMEDLKKQRREK